MIVKNNGRALGCVGDEENITVLLVEQLLEFCRGLADGVYIEDRGAVVFGGPCMRLDDAAAQAHFVVLEI